MKFLDPKNDKKFFVKSNALHESLNVPSIFPLGNMSICIVDDGYLLAIRQFNYFFKEDYTYEFIDGNFFFGRNCFFVLVDKDFNFKKSVDVINNTSLDFKLLEDIKLTKQGNVITLCGTYVADKQIQIAVIACKYCDRKLITTKSFYLSNWNYNSFQKNWMMLPDAQNVFLKDMNENEIVLFNLTDNEVALSRFGVRKSSGSSAIIQHNGLYIALVHRRNKFMYSFNLAGFDKHWNCMFFSDDFKFTESSVEFSCGFAIDGNDFVVPVTENDATTTFFKVDFNYLLNILDIHY